MLHQGQGADRIDRVFDVYKDASIKSAERCNRGSDNGVVFNEIRPGHTVRHWRRLLACADSKNKLIDYLVTSWKAHEKRSKLVNKVLYVTNGVNCFKLSTDLCEIQDDLACSQEEADTRLLLHAQHAAETYDYVVLISDDTDVFVIAVSLQPQFNKGNLFIRRGTKTRMRLINLSTVAGKLGPATCHALPGLHAWTGCDTVSALAGKGKVKAFKLMTKPKHERFVAAFAALGSLWQMPSELFAGQLRLKLSMTCGMKYLRQGKAWSNLDSYHRVRTLYCSTH